MAIDGTLGEESKLKKKAKGRETESLLNPLVDYPALAQHVLVND
jgi:hypothetical protein